MERQRSWGAQALLGHGPWKLLIAIKLCLTADIRFTSQMIHPQNVDGGQQSVETMQLHNESLTPSQNWHGRPVGTYRVTKCVR